MCTTYIHIHVMYIMWYVERILHDDDEGRMIGRMILETKY